MRRALIASVAIFVAGFGLLGGEQLAFANTAQTYDYTWQGNPNGVCSEGSGSISNTDNSRQLNMFTQTIAENYNYCSTTVSLPASWVAVQENLWFWPAVGGSGWSVCNTGPWEQNTYTTYVWSTEWHPATPPCGEGWYYTQGDHLVWQNISGGWVGGQHSTNYWYF